MEYIYANDPDKFGLIGTNRASKEMSRGPSKDTEPTRSSHSDDEGEGFSIMEEGPSEVNRSGKKKRRSGKGDEDHAAQMRKMTVMEQARNTEHLSSGGKLRHGGSPFIQGTQTRRHNAQVSALSEQQAIEKRKHDRQPFMSYNPLGSTRISPDKVASSSTGAPSRKDVRKSRKGFATESSSPRLRQSHNDDDDYADLFNKPQAGPSRPSKSPPQSHYLDVEQSGDEEPGGSSQVQPSRQDSEVAASKRKSSRSTKSLSPVKSPIQVEDSSDFSEPEEPIEHHRGAVRKIVGSAKPMGSTLGEKRHQSEAKKRDKGKGKEKDSPPATAKGRKPKVEVKSSNISQLFSNAIKVGIVQKGPKHQPDTRKFLAHRMVFNTSSSEVSFRGSGVDIGRVSFSHINQQCDICWDEKWPFISFGMNSADLDGSSSGDLHHFAGLSKKNSEDFNLHLLLEIGPESADFMKRLFDKLKTAGRQPCKIEPVCVHPIVHSLQSLIPKQATRSDDPLAKHTAAVAAMDRHAASASSRPGEQSAKTRGKVARNKESKDDDDFEEPSNPKRGRKSAGDDPKQPKITANSFKSIEKQRNEGPIRSSNRLSNKTAVTYEDSDDDKKDDQIVEAQLRMPVPTQPRPENWDGILFPYPLTGRAALNITEGDKWRVTSGDFLNDTLIEFGLKHTMEMLSTDSRSTLNMKDDIHLFSSFFYQKLSVRSKPGETNDDVWPAYDSVKKWTKSVDVFSKKFIIVPINENAHWYLAVIYNPIGVLREYEIPEPSEPIENPPSRRSTRGRPSKSTEPETNSTTLVADLPQEQDHLDQTIPGAFPSGDVASASGRLDPDLDALDSNSGDAAGDETMPEQSKATSLRNKLLDTMKVSPWNGDTTNGSIDPLDVMDEAIDGETLPRGDLPGKSRSQPAVETGEDEAFADQIQELNIEGEQMPGKVTQKKRKRSGSAPMKAIPVSSDNEDAGPEAAPRPIISSTLTYFERQNGQPSAITSEEEQESIENPPSSAMKGKLKVKEDLHIWESDETWILTFDSLGGAHKPVERILGKWLQFEARDKRNINYRLSEPKYKEARVPSQPNYSDCGLFLIHYVGELLARPEETMKFVQRATPANTAPHRGQWVTDMDQIWRSSETTQLRVTWGGIIDSLRHAYTKDKGGIPAGSELASTNEEVIPGPSDTQSSDLQFLPNPTEDIPLPPTVESNEEPLHEVLSHGEIPRTEDSRVDQLQGSPAQPGAGGYTVSAETAGIDPSSGEVEVIPQFAFDPDDVDNQFAGQSGEMQTAQTPPNPLPEQSHHPDEIDNSKEEAATSYSDEHGSQYEDGDAHGASYNEDEDQDVGGQQGQQNTSRPLPSNPSLARPDHDASSVIDMTQNDDETGSHDARQDCGQRDTVEVDPNTSSTRIHPMIAYASQFDPLKSSQSSSTDLSKLVRSSQTSFPGNEPRLQRQPLSISGYATKADISPRFNTTSNSQFADWSRAGDDERVVNAAGPSSDKMMISQNPKWTGNTRVNLGGTDYSHASAQYPPVASSDSVGRRHYAAPLHGQQDSVPVPRHIRFPSPTGAATGDRPPLASRITRDELDSEESDVPPQDTSQVAYPSNASKQKWTEPSTQNESNMSIWARKAAEDDDHQNEEPADPEESLEIPADFSEEEDSEKENEMAAAAPVLELGPPGPSLQSSSPSKRQSSSSRSTGRKSKSTSPVKYGAQFAKAIAEATRSEPISPSPASANASNALSRIGSHKVLNLSQPSGRNSNGDQRHLGASQIQNSDEHQIGKSWSEVQAGGEKRKRTESSGYAENTQSKLLRGTKKGRNQSTAKVVLQPPKHKAGGSRLAPIAVD